jgi:UDP-N-acetylmuramate--alanine ligase
MVDINKFKKVHFIGITAPFSSFCANYLIEQGVEVTASEIDQNSPEAKEWIKRGVLYEGGHDSKYITDDLDLVVFPNAPIPDNPECAMVEKKGIPSIIISELTGIIGKNLKVIAIAGTHGKTTTSALTVWILYKGLGELPNFIIGDKILDIDKSWNFNPKSEYLVLEACEYKEQFLLRAPKPYISVITNIELDHTDYFKSQEQYNEAFVKFISNTQQSVVIDKEGKNVQAVLSNIKNNNLNILDVNEIKKEYHSVTAGLKGDYNTQNVLRACGVANMLDIDVDIEDFPGVSSRFEYKGNTSNGMPVYLDYAHNPKKVKACLSGVKESFPEKKIVFVWQPHSFERTYSFKEQFAKSIDDADVIYIPNIFAHRREPEEYKELISEKEFVDFLQDQNTDKEIVLTKDSDKFDNTTKLLLNKEYDDNYVCVLASAGDLYKILPMLNLNK